MNSDDPSPAGNPLFDLLPIFLDAFPASCFAIGGDGRALYWNAAARKALNIPPGTCPERAYMPFYPSERPAMADLVLAGAADAEIDALYKGHWTRDPFSGSVGSEGFFPHLGENGLWLSFLAHPLKDSQGRILAVIETLIDITAQKNSAKVDQDIRAGLSHIVSDLEHTLAAKNKELTEANAALAADNRMRLAAEEALRKKNEELTSINETLEKAQNQLVQSEKLISLGQLAAGVAHEINNPIGFVSSNLSCIASFAGSLRKLVAECKGLCQGPADPAFGRIAQILAELDADWFLDEIGPLLSESDEGLARVKKIVMDLKDFSRSDNGQKREPASLAAGLRQTASIAHNEIKYCAALDDRLPELPHAVCNLSQINQVFLNILVNAAQACSQRKAGNPSYQGLIVLDGGAGPDRVWIEIRDNAGGIPADAMPKIFDPFFTTKPVGKGTGLGLSISYGIIAAHGGTLRASNRDGGACFRIELPLDPQHSPSA